MSDTTPLPCPTDKPVKKTKWYWYAINIPLSLWLFVGIRGLLLQDIPMLLFVGFAFMLPFLPVTRFAE